MQTDPRYPRWRVFYVVVLSLLFVAGETGWAFLEDPERLELMTLREWRDYLVSQFDQISDDSVLPTRPITPTPNLNDQAQSPTFSFSTDPVWMITNERFPPGSITVQDEMLYIDGAWRGIQVIDNRGFILREEEVDQSFSDFSVLPGGNLVIYSYQLEDNRIRVLSNSRLATLHRFGNSISVGGLLSDLNPIDVNTTAESIVALDSNGGRLLDSPRIYRFSPSGEVMETILINQFVDANARFALGSDGSIYVPLTRDRQILKIDSDRNQVLYQLDFRPLAVDVDRNNRLVILSSELEDISLYLFENEETLITEIGINGGGLPRDVAFYQDQIVLSTNLGVFAFQQP